jgi:Peptidase family C25
MKNFLVTCIVVLLVGTTQAQLNNSWIDYNKTYYKFKIAKDSLCRIPQSALSAIGLGSTPAQNFQLWRNGKEVRMYTSVVTGALAATDYIEFWGEMNDGKADKNLFRDPDFHLDDKYSLFSDTAAYFLTVNAATANLRYTQSANPVASNVLPAELYFMRKVESHYKQQINRGYAAKIGESVYSSAFDIGEGWTSNNINTNAALSDVIYGLNKYNAGPANSVTFTISAFGNELYTRDLFAKLNNTEVLPPQNPMPFFSYHKDTVRNLPLSVLTSPDYLGVSIKGNNSSSPGNDQIVLANYSVTYPATFKFNNLTNFYFELAASATGNFVTITNFNNNGVEPILYDMTTGRRYLGDISTAGEVKFALPPSAEPVRKFNLMSQHAANVYTIASGITTRNFVNIANVANQGDYLIISNPVLYNNGSGVNYVDQYRQYRSSVAGGGYNAKIFDIGELTDQFGFGIKNHPSAIRDFVRYATQQFSVKPKFLLLIGRAVVYNDYKRFEAEEAADKLNLVPTFGWPASDVLLVSNPGTVVPLVAVGRLGAIKGDEVGNYLEKMKQYEQAQNSPSQTIASKAWMKNIIHISGGADSLETANFVGHLNRYKAIAEDTLFGAHVETFAKSGSGSVQEANSNRIEQLFKEGLSYITYFGHSSASTLAFNLSVPETYQNQGKYPFFNVSGCSAGNFFNYDPSRLLGNLSLSEKYTFANQKGSIGFFANTHFGIEPFLNYYNLGLYNEFSRVDYGGSVGTQIKKVIESIGGNPLSLDYYSRIHMEEMTLQGDPALKINYQTKPDFIVEEQLIKVSPSIISVADNNFNINVKMLNIGRVVKDSIRVTVKHKLPNDSIRVLFNQLIPSIKYSDSLSFVEPINRITDKGLNKIIVSLDVDNKVSEISELNNTIEKEFYIYEDEVRPVYPYSFSIINKQNITYAASTANPLAQQKQYVMEIDTTEFFNSSFKKTFNASGNGGVVEFKPTTITFTDSTVYYWRTSMAPTGNSTVIWNTSSFVYLPTATNGWNQSHLYQHFKSAYTNITLDSATRALNFKPRTSIIVTNNGMYPTTLHEGNEFSLQINGAQYIESNCKGQSIVFNLFNPASLDPVLNAVPGAPGRWGSINPCAVTNQYDFEFEFWSHPTTAVGVVNRKKIRDFMDSIPTGFYVVARLATADPNVYTGYGWAYAQDWKTQDEAAYGAGNSLTTKLKNAGFAEIDSFNRPRLWTFVYKKGDNSYAPNYSLGNGTQKHSYEFNIYGKQAEGTIISPVFGPSKKWEFLHWRGTAQETPTADVTNIGVYGIANNGSSTLLKTITNARDTALDFVDANQYPYLQLKMNNSDYDKATPYQLNYWRVNGQLVPEGVVAPNILYQMKDTVDQGEPIDFKVAFKNISPAAFDSSMKFKLIITDNSNIPHTINIPKGKVLIAGDTLSIQYKIDSKIYPGNNTLFLDVNPGFDQPEQSHFNNVLFKDFYVKPDNYNPLLDVTFDGVHILNEDIISAKPHIYIKLKDESRFMLLSDTALLKVQVIFPDKTVHSYNFGDTMRFNPASPGSGENAASIDFMPYFTEDGYYELVVSGKDVIGNKAGNLEYRVTFKVFNKPMISNLFNYPNPFTTSTAFVFTVTGSEVPQNIRIQVLTITGKVVREITKDELGDIHIGRNITSFKWDGTDTYGAKLANGVYLYRVLTNLNGQSLDKYKVKGEKTDNYFTKGYGKMVIIR